jgi:voltage-gated sodium channel
MSKIRLLFLNDVFILALILINAITIFINGFDIDPWLSQFLFVLDNTITVLFIIELITKISVLGVKGYFSSGWNRFDFALIVISIPAFISNLFDLGLKDLDFILVLRVLRVFKTFRFIKFIPGIDKMLSGVVRALKSSIIVILGFFIYIFIIGILSFQMFHNISPEYFGTPTESLYSIFKIFTVEGWFEIPEDLTKNMGKTASIFTNLFFIIILITGGIFGLSLVNSIFVDAMVSDNNDELEEKVDRLDEKVNELLNRID